MRCFKIRFTPIICAVIILTLTGCSRLTNRQSIRRFSPTPTSPAYSIQKPEQTTQSIKADTIEHRPVDSAKKVEVPTLKEPPLPQFDPFDKEQSRTLRSAKWPDFIKRGRTLLIPLGDLAKEFVMPLDREVTSPYNNQSRHPHTGVDFATTEGDTIRCIANGIVRMARYYSGYGNILIVRHSCGIESLYAHHRHTLVRPNEIIRAGAPIAIAGTTDRTSTPHLHFELRADSKAFNPELLIDFQNNKLHTTDTLRLPLH